MRKAFQNACRSILISLSDPFGTKSLLVSLDNAGVLNGYVELVNRIRQNQNKNMDIAAAVDEAMRYFIANDYIAEFLMRQKEEVKDMCLYDYDAEYQRKLDRRDAKEEGRKEEREVGIRNMIDALRDMNATDEQICHALEKSYHLSKEEAEAYFAVPV